MQRLPTILVSLALTLLATSAAATTCAENACEVGQQVRTYNAPGEPVAACPTDALAAYSNFMLYLVAIRRSKWRWSASRNSAPRPRRADL